MRKKLLFVGILEVTDEKEQDPDTDAAGPGFVNQVCGSKDPNPDPYQNVSDPEHWFLRRENQSGESIQSMIRTFRSSSICTSNIICWIMISVYCVSERREECLMGR